jgi:phosphopantothenoylcysteine synthetase/decarboxylase
MIAKKVNQKMVLNKITVANLSALRQKTIKAGSPASGQETCERLCLTEICITVMFPCPTEIYCTTDAPTCI